MIIRKRLSITSKSRKKIVREDGKTKEKLIK